MSSIVLSASVRQNLLSLQSTASLLATTQNDLATGNKVNSALDNPTSFFTASALNNRAGDISNLLDGIGNGVQVLQAANTGITSLQSLVASAQSIANQVLQTPIGYSAKSSVTATAITGATANNLLGTATGTGPAGNAVATATGLPTVDLTASLATNALATAGTALAGINLSVAALTNATAAATGTITPINLTADGAKNATVTGTVSLTAGLLDPGTGTDTTFSINGNSITLAGGSGTGVPPVFSLGDIENAINTTTNVGVTASANSAGDLILTSTGTAGAADSIVTSGLGTVFGIADGNNETGVAATNDSFEINGSTVTLAGGFSYDGTAIASAIQSAVSGVTASYASGKLVVTSTGTAGVSDQLALTNFTGAGFDATSLGFPTAAPTPFTGTDAGTASSDSFEINGVTVALNSGTDYTPAGIAAAINGVSVTSHVSAAIDPTGHLVLSSTGTAGAADKIALSNFTGTGFDATSLGFATAAPAPFAGTDATTPTDLTFNVNGNQVKLTAGQTYTATSIAAAITAQVPASANVSATVDATTGNLVLTSTGTAGVNDKITVNDFSSGDATQLGFATATETDNGTAATESIAGQTLTIASTGGGTATNITFGTAAGQISSLNALNTALSANNLQATIDSTGVLTITTSNNASSSTIGAIGGTATTTVAATGTTPATAGAFAAVTAGGAAPVVDPNAQATRTGLVDQYNNILKQIDTTSQDSSFNGINLLQGDTLNLTFDETGKSTLAIKGVTFNTAGLGLATLTSGTDFLDSNSANTVLSSLTQVSTTLRSEASSLGSNLSIVQIRQDFSKNLINVLQTGASNLTLADTNEEAANSQALSTRQSIAVSALALANQSQQSVLQLLR